MNSSCKFFFVLYLSAVAKEPPKHPVGEEKVEDNAKENDTLVPEEVKGEALFKSIYEKHKGSLSKLWDSSKFSDELSESQYFLPYRSLSTSQLSSSETDGYKVSSDEESEVINLDSISTLPDTIDISPSKEGKDILNLGDFIDVTPKKDESINKLGKEYVPDLVEATPKKDVLKIPHDKNAKTSSNQAKRLNKDDIKKDKEKIKYELWNPNNEVLIPELDHIPTAEEELLLEQYKKEENIYYQYPPPLLKIRRHFDPHDGKIGSISRFLAFVKHYNIGIKNKEDVCNKQFEHEDKACALDNKYRTMDGTCNNIKKPFVGATLMPYDRTLPPDYGDKKSLPRGVSSYSLSTGYTSHLPSPRLVSSAILQDVKNPNTTEDASHSHLIMQWGQFIDHDITDTVKTAFQCCHPDIRTHRRCFPIQIPSDDHWFSQFGRTCLDFTRSNIHCGRGEKKHPEQFSAATAYIDASMVYGNDEATANVLRGGEARRRGGQLLHNQENPHMLPARKALGAHIDNVYYQVDDIVAGDRRAQGQATLLSLHNVFFLEHNRIAQVLYDALRPHTNMDQLELDEVIFQEARKLIAATIQHITYNEWLPKVLGNEQMKVHKIHMDQDCPYSPTTDAAILNEFSTAAMRFGHSLIQNVFRGKGQPWRLGAAFAEKFFAVKDGGHGYANEMEGAADQPCQTVDVHICDSMTQSLFVSTKNLTGDEKKTMKGKGHDIGSLNIQRGRDHGIRSYDDYRTHCGLQPIKDMNTKPTEISLEDWEKFKSVYREPSQIDLYPGGLAEAHVPGGIVGPTFACIIGQQFRQLMDGDRFFYRHDSGPNIRPLTGAALASIKKRKLSCLICENTDISELAMESMIRPGVNNPKVPCKEHGKLDLNGIVEDLLNEIAM